MNANETLRDAYILRGILTERVANNSASKIKREYKKILDDLIKQIKSYDEINIKSMNKLIKELRDRIKPNLTLATDLQELALSEASFVQSTINASATIEILKKLPKDSTLLRIANAPIYQGSTVLEAFSLENEKLKQRVASQIRLAVMNGESIPEINKRLQTAIGATYNEAEKIARTATSGLVNRVRDEVYKENEDIFKGYQWVATLDGSTRVEHFIRDGLQWDLNHNPIGHDLKWEEVPFGYNCRCIIIPILKSYKELGLNTKEITGLTRSSLDGSVPQKQTATKWFETKGSEFQEKFLGKGRYELFKDGKITLRDLIDKNGEILTIKELEKL